MNFYAFFEKVKYNMANFDPQKEEHLQEVIRRGIDFYNLQSYVEKETLKEGIKETLHIHSIVEENVLSKIIAIATKDENDITLEDVFNGRLIRHF